MVFEIDSSKCLRYCMCSSATFIIQVFIVPLKKVTSTAIVDGLLRLCQSSHDRLFLQELGMTIGIKSWSDDFMEMQQQHQKAEPVSLGKTDHHQPHTMSTSTKEVCAFQN